MSAKTIELLRHPQNLKMLLQMFTFAAVTPLLLKFYPLERLLGMVTPDTKRRQNGTSTVSAERIIQLGVLLLKRDRLFLKNSCLKRSLLLYYFLRKHGVEVCIHFGVKKNDGYLAGHSWLTRNGIVLADAGQQGKTFTAVISFPSQKTQRGF